MSGVTIHHVEIAKPVDMLLEIILADEGRLKALNFAPFAEMLTNHEIAVYRAMTFVQDLVKRADQRARPIKMVAAELKNMPNFEIEYAVMKAVAEVQADGVRAATAKLFKKGTA